MSSVLTSSRKELHKRLLDSLLSTAEGGSPSNADANNRLSVAVARGIVARLGTGRVADRMAAQTAGSEFEEEIRRFIKATFEQLSALRPGNWQVERIAARQHMPIARYEQYAHLSALQALAQDNPELAAALGSDYTIAPDVVVARVPVPDAEINSEHVLVDEHTALLSPIRESNNQLPILHATISCKWTIRSDRAQNSRSEGLNLVKNRKGRLPHVAVVTAEPLPSRIASIALGTGEIDCVYHIALTELRDAVQETGHEDAIELLSIMIDGRRLRDISDLPLDLAV